MLATGTNTVADSDIKGASAVRSIDAFGTVIGHTIGASAVRWIDASGTSTVAPAMRHTMADVKIPLAFHWSRNGLPLVAVTSAGVMSSRMYASNGST